jgi:hypothetical protein
VHHVARGKHTIDTDVTPVLQMVIDTIRRTEKHSLDTSVPFYLVETPNAGAIGHVKVKLTAIGVVARIRKMPKSVVFSVYRLIAHQLPGAGVS